MDDNDADSPLVDAREAFPAPLSKLLQELRDKGLTTDQIAEILIAARQLRNPADPPATDQDERKSTDRK